MELKKIRSIGARLIEGFVKKGCVDCGINGPYDDPETEVRYLAHLIVIAAIEYLKFGKTEYKDVVLNLGDRVLSMKGEDGIYKMRLKDGKDQCNGVIGHAWLIEGLIYAYKVTGEDKFIDESFAICQKHEFNQVLGLWGRPLMGKDDSAIDFTFNHELWYAATLAELLQIRKDNKLQMELDRFMESVPKNLLINGNGRIAHSIYRRVKPVERLKQCVKRHIIVFDERIGRPSLKYKEIGYHIFNLMAFARIFVIRPDYPFFTSTNFFKTLKYVCDKGFVKGLLDEKVYNDSTPHGKSLTIEEQSINIYGYPYNVPGFELPYCALVFEGQIDNRVVDTIVKTQIEETWDGGVQMFGRKSHDKVAVNYRIYEYYRYLEIVQ